MFLAPFDDVPLLYLFTIKYGGLFAYDLNTAILDIDFALFSNSAPASPIPPGPPSRLSSSPYASPSSGELL